MGWRSGNCGQEISKATNSIIHLKLIDVAKAKIFDANKSVSEIAHELGFKSPQHCNPLLLDGEPLDYSDFNLHTKGELTVSKGVATGQTTQIPFYVYLRRDGNKVLIPGKELPDPGQIKIDISEILSHAEPGDHLVIEAVRKEDGPVKRILKLLGLGC